MYHTLITRLGRLSLAVALFAAVGVAIRSVPIARAAAITVNTTADDNTVNGNCTLREAIRAANTDSAVDACPAGSGADTIILATGTYTLTIAGAGEDTAQTGDLDITEDLTITGSGRLRTAIDANGLDRAFHILNGAVVQISEVTIQGGDPGVLLGGNILVSPGALTLIRARVMAAASDGIWITGASTLILENSRIADNARSGLGIAAGVTALVLNSTISGNGSPGIQGGGIATSGTLTVVNSTISGNTATIGGGMVAFGSVHLYNVTITNNAGFGGGFILGSGGQVTARNTIIAGNTDHGASLDCQGTLTSEGYNLVQTIFGCTIEGDATGNITGVSANLGPLQDNGGPTLTHALQAGSPAIDAGNPSGCVDYNNVALTIDQRGFARPIDGDGDGNARCDMGAFERLSSGTPTPTNTPTATNTATPTRTPTSTSTHTATPTNTPSPSPTSTSTATQTPTATATHTATPTNTSTVTPNHWLYLPLIQK
jgi:CSLREA domain-containing protein